MFVMFAKHDKHYPSRSGQTSLATRVTNFTKPVTKIYSGPSMSCIGLPSLLAPPPQLRILPNAALLISHAYVCPSAFLTHICCLLIDPITSHFHI